MKNELTQQERVDVEFYQGISDANSHKVNGIWEPLRKEQEVVSGLSEEDQKRYYRGKNFDLLGHYSLNGVPATADDIRKQLQKEGRY